MRLRGWIGTGVLLVLALFSAVGLFAWNLHVHTKNLEQELAHAQKLLRTQESQVLSLTGKLKGLEEDVLRVQQFDAKLRVIMNVEQDGMNLEADDGPDKTGDASSGLLPGTGSGALNNPLFLSRHRDLYLRRLHSLVDELETTVRLEEVDQQKLVGFLRSNKESLLSTPSIWPVKGYLTSSFGWRRAPLSGATRMHKGLDISTPTGTPVRAPARGEVTFSGWDGAYGICITIDHGGGITTRYAHLAKAAVKVGDYVQRGDVIGAVGNTGRSTGPHLHYEVRVKNVPVNPMRYILN